MKKVTACRSCGGELEMFLDLGKQPYANSLLKSTEEAEGAYPLALSFCRTCTLVQLTHSAEPTDLFSHYVWVTSTSSTARRFAETFYAELMRRTTLGKDEYVLEVASNDGTFLRPFQEHGHTVLGIDPAANIVEMAQAAGVPTLCRFFGAEAAQDLVRERGHAKVIFARNVLPHVAGTHDLIEGLRIALADDGLLAIEVHYAKKIFEELQYDSIYHEHICYFTLRSVEEALKRHGLYVTDIAESPISGGALILYCAPRAPAKAPAMLARFRAAEEKLGLHELARWREFAERVATHREAFLQLIKEEARHGRVVGYGASARSSTLLNYCGIGPELIAEIADQNPLKQGLYTAGTHIRIDDPGHVFVKSPSAVVILAWNFTDEILDILRRERGYVGPCIVPLPISPRRIEK